MKQHFYYLMNALGVCCLIACNSDNTIGLPDEGNEKPVFSVEAREPNSNILHFKQAGLDNYYLFTFQETDALGVANSVTSLRKEDCQSDCPESYEFRMTYRSRVAAPAKNLIQEGRYLLRNTLEDAELCQVQVDNVSKITTDSFFWLFGDSASISNQQSAINNYVVEDGKDYFIRLVVTDTQQRIHSLAKRNSPNSFNTMCTNPVVLAKATEDSIWLTMDADSRMDADYFAWVQGDSIYTTDTLALKQGENFSFFYEDNKGCALDYIGYAEAGGGTLSNTIEFTSTADCIMQGSRYQLSRMEMRYVDENGKLYTSSQYNNRGNFVNISELKPYLPNENDVPTQSATLEIRRIGLRAADGDTRIFENVLAKIAFAQP